MPADSASVLTTAACVPTAHRTEKVEKPDETVCEPRRHSCQFAFSQPYALSMYLTQLSDIYTILETVVLAELLCPISHVSLWFGAVRVLEIMQVSDHCRAAVLKFTISILRAAVHQYESEV